MDEAVYASNASTWLVETRGLQIKSSLGCTVKPSLKMGMKDFFFLVDRNFSKYIGFLFNPETEIDK